MENTNRFIKLENGVTFNLAPEGSALGAPVLSHTDSMQTQQILLKKDVPEPVHEAVSSNLQTYTQIALAILLLGGLLVMLGVIKR